MKKLLLVVFAGISIWSARSEAQINATPKELRHQYVSPEQIVTITSTTPFDQALAVLDSYSRKFLNKIIVDPNNHTMPIGVDVDRMQWLDALETILRTNNLWYKEYESYLQIISGEQQQQQQPVIKVEEKPAGPPPGTPTLDSREINIQVIFFEADLTKLNSHGINIDYLIKNTWNNISAIAGTSVPIPNVGVTAGATLTNGVPSVNGQFTLGGAYNINNFGTLSALFGLLETEDMGKILASPDITVRSGQTGNVQVGENFFVTTKDFAGNTIQQMQNAGIMINATPTVFTEDSIDFIGLDLNLTNSSLAGLGTSSMIINSEQAQTKVLLLNGEQTTIGGLYNTTQTAHREGIPVLKDLPWWVFGIRYLTGSENLTNESKELIILLKASILPTLRERNEQQAKVGPAQIRTFQQRLQEFEQSVKQYDQQSGK
jgi:type IV pilus assembly protein PilQ